MSMMKNREEKNGYIFKFVLEQVSGGMLSIYLIPMANNKQHLVIP